jgi:trans-aconitate methyltransferase
MSAPPNVSAFAFEHRYRANPDPWNFAGSAYERGRYRATMDALPRPGYGMAYEPGCSVGELTAQLAEICERVVATDIAPSAVDSARRRCAALANVDIYCADAATHAPPGPFDLIVFSEIGYYFTAPRLRLLAASMAARLCPGGDLIAVHWRGYSRDHLLHGDVVHSELRSHLPLQWLSAERHPGFQIDAWRRR